MRGSRWSIGVLAMLFAVPVLAASRLDDIVGKGRVRVCIWPDYYGITYRNPKTQQLSGIDIEMASELGRDLGVDVDGPYKPDHYRY